jgi:glycerol-3-phosphate acyltransferase PlsY
MTSVLLWTLVGFLAGSIPFSLIAGKMLAHKDIRAIADGNPGGMNALRAGGLKAGLPAILLDIGKGFLPVFFAMKYGAADWELVPIGLAPILGHAFSPLLHFRGGKALAATGGAWLALIGLPVFPIYAALALPFTLLQSEDAWSANAGMLALLVYAAWADEPWMIAFAVLNTMIVVWTHRRDLVRRPQLRPWAANWLARRGA